MVSGLTGSESDLLATPEGYLKYDIKKGASLDPGHQSIGYWNGSVYGWTYGSGQEPSYEKLFLFEGFKPMTCMLLSW